MDGYKFGKDFTSGSAGDFKGKVKARYPKLKAKELNALVEREYGTDKGKEKLEEDVDSTGVQGSASPSDN